jgi:UPF0716 protein FxsA
MVSLILFGLLVGLPILEVYTFIQVGAAIDVWPTIGLVLLTAMLGTALIRWQGVAVLRRAQEALARGEAPLREVFDGVCLLIAGALLLTPGFITDSIGFALVLPPVRMLVLLAVVSGVKSGKLKMSGRGRSAGRPGAGFDQGAFTGSEDLFRQPHSGTGWQGPTSDPGVVDGDYRDVTDQKPRQESQAKKPDADPQ